MARSYGIGDTIRNASFGAVGASGTISIWINPAWSSGSGATHAIWNFGSAVGKDNPSFQRYLDNNIYCGFAGGAHGDQRIVISDGGLFTSGAWANWVFTWSGAGAALYKNGSSVGTHGAMTADTDSQFGVGNYGGAASPGTSCDGTLADFAYWSVALSAGEIAALAAGARPLGIRPTTLGVYLPLDGLSSPEPDFSGNANNGTLTGTTYANGPPVTFFTPRWRTPPDVASGGSGITASGAFAELADVLAGTGGVLVSGTSALTERADAFAGTGTVASSISGSAALQELADTFAGTGKILVAGTAALVEINDAFAGTGTVASGIAGSASLQELVDTLSGTGAILVSGTAALRESVDAFAAASGVLVSGSAALQELDDIFAGSGLPPATLVQFIAHNRGKQPKLGFLTLN